MTSFSKNTRSLPPPVAPASTSVKFAPEPTKEVAVNAPVAELKDKLLPVFGARSPVAAVANIGKHVVSLDSSAKVIVVAIDAVPVTFPVKAPANPVAVKTPEDELKVKFVPVLGAKFPVAAVTNKTLQEVSVDSSVTGKVEILAAGNIPEEIFDASVVSVVAELDNPAIFEAAIAAELLISALTITASFIS